jgi:hypothetical protein
MQKAISNVENDMSFKKDGELYFILEYSIRAWKTGAVKSKHMDPPTILISEEENSLIKWCEVKQKVAHCASINLLKEKVQQICSPRDTPFKDGLLSRKWWKSF